MCFCLQWPGLAAMDQSLIYWNVSWYTYHADLKTDFILSNCHTDQVKTSGVLLGVEIDNSLRWKQHVEQIKMEAITSITALSCLAGSVWGGRLKTIWALYQAIVIPQITYCCSVWYAPPGLPGYKKYIFKLLQIILGKASKIVNGAFKATSLPALHIEAFLLPISLKLDKFVGKSLLQIVSGQLYKTIINKRPKSAQSKQLSLLESLISQFQEDRTLALLTSRELSLLFHPLVGTAQNNDCVK